MTHLTFSRLSEDGAQIILLDKAGAQYRVAVTDRLRAAVLPTERETALQMRIPVDGPVTPRDVQRKLRHGATITDVVAESGMPVEKVENFAVPVFQERAYVAQQALECPVPSGGSLGEAVMHKLRSRGIEDEPEWDSWRRHDGTWTVVVRFASDLATVPMSDEAGEFLYDPKSRSVVAENDVARWLTNAPELAEPEPDRVILIEDDDDNGQRWDDLHPSVRGVRTEIDLADEPEPQPANAAAGTGHPHLSPEHSQSDVQPLSRRAARRRAARKRAERREPTWDEILFGVSRGDDDSQD
jgi:hypothetical protein